MKDSENRIVFNAPVMGRKSKAVISGTDYPEAGVFRVWGFFSYYTMVQSNLAMPVEDDHGIGYIDGALCAKEEEGTNWVPYYTYKDANQVNQTGYYYWKDNAGIMTFHALSPSSIPAEKITHDWKTGFAISDYTVADDDILFSAYHQSACTDAGVDITFRHALSVVQRGQLNLKS